MFCSHQMNMTLWPCLMVVLGLCSLATAASVSLNMEEDSPSANTTAASAANATQPGTNQTGTQTPYYNESVEVFVERNITIEEGDIIVQEDRNAANSVWSNAIVPYELSPELGHRWNEIQAAFRMISAPTCVQFVQRTNEFNYIELKDGQGCASLVGVSGGSQPVYFGATCTVGNLAHELIHALGLYHEHTRSDRDGYITINWSNIIPNKAENFKVKSGNTLNQPYDFESIMHYGKNYFSVDGSPTIEAEGRDIGQRTRLSRLDIKKLQALYRC